MTKIRKETFGGGKPIVLVHGWAMHSGIWRDFAKELAKSYRVTLVDLPGHGQSEVLEPFTLATVSQALVKAIDDVSSCWLGWSLGAAFVLEIAKEYPDRVDSLVLLAGSPCFVKKNFWPGMDGQILDNFAKSLQQDSQAALLKFLALQVKGLDDQKTALQRLKNLVYESRPPDPKILEEGLIILKETDLRPEFSRLQSPVAVILGQLDTLIPVAVAQQMQALLPSVGLTLLARAGHVPFLTHQAAVVEAVSRFMDTR